MNLNANEIRLSQTWQRIALSVFAVSFSVALLPMLLWPQSNMARGFCMAMGFAGSIALLSLIFTATRCVIAPSRASEDSTA